MSNLVSGTTTGSLSLTQATYGGNGGGTDGGNPGTGGNASSSLVLIQSGLTQLTAAMSAIGGVGGSTQNNNGGAGGLSTASVSLTGSELVSASASAGNDSLQTGGVTGGMLVGFTGGAGGSGTATATATGSGTAAGASAVTAATNAQGQAGGDVASSVFGTGGAGGSATALSIASGAGPDMVSATASATAGAGGQGVGNGFLSGNAGNAIATATATSTGGPAAATTTAQGGAAGAVTGGATIGSPGTTTSTATATGINASTSSASGGAATAVANASGSTLANSTASASGLSGNSIAKSTTTGLFSIVRSIANAPGDNVGNAASISTIDVASSAPAFNTTADYESAAYTIAAPLSADVSSAWSADANVQNAFGGTTGNVNALLLTNMQYASGGTGVSHDYSTTLELNENNALLNSNDLLVGMLFPKFTNAGLQSGDSLRFRIEREGVTIYDQTLLSNSAVTSNLQNSVFNLGAQNADLSGGNLDVQFLFDFTTTHPGSGVGEELLVGNNAAAPIGTWVHPTGGSWATPGDWSANTLPDGPGVQAVFGSAIGSSQTVTLDENTTVGSLQFNNINSYNISSGAGGYSLTLDNAGTPAMLSVVTGNHTISAPISVTSAGISAGIASGSTLTLAGKITGAGPLALTESGTLQLGAGIGQVEVTSLSIASSASLDITNNALFIDYGSGPDPIASIAAWIKNGYYGLPGPSIISSVITTDDALSGLSYGIGYADSADVGNPANLPTDTIEIMYTLLGDANLDGTVNSEDFTPFSHNLGQSGMMWDDGDFNYDGTVNAEDFTLFSHNIGQSASLAAAAGSFGNSQRHQPCECARTRERGHGGDGGIGNSSTPATVMSPFRSEIAPQDSSRPRKLRKTPLIRRSLSSPRRGG